jgi:outer membrane lipoprotein carrier protein
MTRTIRGWSFTTAHRTALRRALVAGAVLAAAASLSLAGRTVPDRLDELEPRVREALERMESSYEGLDAYRARIVETRTLSVLADEQVLRGSLVYAKPGRLRWEYREPEHRIYVLVDDELTGWIPADKRVERVDLGRYQRRVDDMFAPGEGAEGLVQEFEIELGSGDPLEGTDHLVLEPRSRRVRRKISTVHLWIDRQSGMMRRLGYVVPPGDRVTIDFVEIERNPGVDEAVFELDLPEDAEVVEGETSFGVPGLTDSD